MSAKPTTKEHDPVAAALAAAPLGPVELRPPTEEELRNLEEARASAARGERTYTDDRVRRVIEEKRRRQEGE